MQRKKLERRMKNQAHEACIIALDAAIEISLNACIPRLSFEEFLDLAELIWEKYDHQIKNPLENPVDVPEDI